MNLSLSKRGEYGLRVALFLASTFPVGQPVKIRQIVAETEIPRSFASQIMSDLIRAELVESRAGKSGGYVLTRDPATILLSDLVKAVEENFDATENDMKIAIPLANTSPRLARALQDATQAYFNELGTVSLGQLSADFTDARKAPPATLCPVGEESVPIGSSMSIKISLPLVMLIVAKKDTQWLLDVVDEIRQDKDEIYIRVGPAKHTWLAKTVVVSVGSPTQREDILEIPIAWEASGPSQFFPRLYAKLIARSSGENTELELRGHYHVPLGRAGKLINNAGLHLIADATIKSFLNRVGKNLEDQFNPQKKRNLV